MKRSPRGLALAALIASAVLGGCGDSALLDIDLERMIVQRKYLPYRASEFFDDGRAMRTPPDGTVPRGRGAGDDPTVSQGVVAGAYVDRIPILLTRELLARGQSRF